MPSQIDGAEPSAPDKSDKAAGSNSPGRRLGAARFAAFVSGLLCCNVAYAAGDFPLASCKGWNGTIVESSGVNSQSAVIRGIVTKADVQEYCERDPGGVTKQYGGKLTAGQCVSQVLN